MSISRRLAVIGAVSILTIGVLVVLQRSPVDGPAVAVGSIDDFPLGSISHLDMRVRVADPHPQIEAQFKDGVADLPVFIVHHPDLGVLALSAFDPHLGCRVGLASDSHIEIRRHLTPEIAFVNPCHGEKYDLAGSYVAGPAPRGLDRYRVTIDERGVSVDFSAFIYGPDRGS